MPGRTTSTAARTGPTKSFQIPAFEFKFAALTEGTNIPPPLPSPIKEEKPELPAKDEATNGAKPQAQDATQTNGVHPPTSAQPAVNGGTKRPADDVPISPTSSRRPGSIRRLFSRNLLNKDYANAEQAYTNGHGDATSLIRPMSRSGGSVLMGDKKARRSSGWFRRLVSGEFSAANGTANKRASQLYSADDAKRTMGPPPPMIPELTDLESNKDGGSLGNDLFKNISIPE